MPYTGIKPSRLMSTTPPSAVAKYAGANRFLCYEVHLLFTDKLCGGTPFVPPVIARWISQNIQRDEVIADYEPAQLEAMGYPHGAAMPTPEELEFWSKHKNVYGFPWDDQNGYYFEARKILAGFKEWARVTATGAKARPLTISRRLKGNLFVLPERMPLENADGKRVPHMWERAFQLVTPQGPREITRRTQYFSRPYLRFILLLTRKVEDVKTPALQQMAAVGELSGLGADRGIGAGRFVVTRWQLCDPFRTEPILDPIRAATEIIDPALTPPEWLR
jgi:hypothetical protein